MLGAFGASLGANDTECQRADVRGNRGEPPDWNARRIGHR